MKKAILTITFAAVLALAADLQAAPGDNAASFLRIDAGARQAAMAGAYAGVGGDILSVFTNPAGLASLEGYGLSFSHALWLESISYTNFVAGIPVLDGYAALGLSGLMAGRIDKYDLHGSALGETYSPSDIAVTAAYSRVISGVSAGAAVKFITSEIDGDRASAIAVDLGAMRRVGPVNAGAAVQNLGTGMKFREESSSLPLAFRLGASYPFSVAGLDLLAAAETSFSTEVSFRVNAGINADYSLNGVLLSLRLGFRSYAEGLDTLSRLTTGMGIAYGNIGFDYALASFEDLGLTHRVSLGYSFN